MRKLRFLNMVFSILSGQVTYFSGILPLMLLFFGSMLSSPFLLARRKVSPKKGPRRPFLSVMLGRLTGMVAWGRQKLCFTQAPRVPGSGPTRFPGHPPWPKGASRQGERACLRPQAEFARSSGRGLRRVREFRSGRDGDVQKNREIGLEQLASVLPTTRLIGRRPLNITPLQYCGFAVIILLV